MKKCGISCHCLNTKCNLNKIDVSITASYIPPLQASGFFKKNQKIKRSKFKKMEKNRAPPPLPHQKIENQNVSKTEEQHEKNIDVSIQNDKRFEGLKIETIQKSDENATISKAAEQLEDIIDPQTQDEFGLPCIRDMPNNALATLVDVAGQQSQMEAKSLYKNCAVMEHKRFRAG